MQHSSANVDERGFSQKHMNTRISDLFRDNTLNKKAEVQTDIIQTRKCQTLKKSPRVQSSILKSAALSDQ